MESFKAWQDYQKDAIYRTVVARRPDTRVSFHPTLVPPNSLLPTLLFPIHGCCGTFEISLKVKPKFPWHGVRNLCDRKFHRVIARRVVTRFCLSLRFLANKLARSSHEWRPRDLEEIPLNSYKSFTVPVLCNHAASFVSRDCSASLAFARSIAWLAGTSVSTWMVHKWNEVSTGCNVSCK